MIVDAGIRWLSFMTSGREKEQGALYTEPCTDSPRRFFGTDNLELTINRSSDRGEEVVEQEMQLHSEADSRRITKLTAHLWRPSEAETKQPSSDHQETHQLLQNGPPDGKQMEGWIIRFSWLACLHQKGPCLSGGWCVEEITFESPACCCQATSTPDPSYRRGSRRQR
ncbi:hypothetical protein Baya_8613 [Bagarius yarrelli]|uniref:Uncharacterized protein n=1 Tax=Bagarius yarrelli TaxID=175774 RepID=A0A556U4F9_BAGYA|nr:hypothetical protein Baya_8613 [Bagarius yarrelli]